MLGGVDFLDLGSLSLPDHLPSTLASTLSFSVQTSERSSQLLNSGHTPLPSPASASLSQQRSNYRGAGRPSASLCREIQRKGSVETDTHTARCSQVLYSVTNTSKHFEPTIILEEPFVHVTRT